MRRRRARCSRRRLCACMIRLVAAAERSAGRPHGSAKARIISAADAAGIRHGGQIAHALHEQRAGIDAVLDLQRLAHQIERVGRARFGEAKLECAVDDAERVEQLAVPQQRTAEIEIGIRQPRVGADRLLEMRDRVRGAPRAHEERYPAHCAPARGRLSAPARARSPRWRRRGAPLRHEDRRAGSALRRRPAGAAARERSRRPPPSGRRRRATRCRDAGAPRRSPA